MGIYDAKKARRRRKFWYFTAENKESQLKIYVICTELSTKSRLRRSKRVSNISKDSLTLKSHYVFDKRRRRRRKFFGMGIYDVFRNFKNYV